MKMPDILIVVATALEAERVPKLQAARVVVSGIGAVNAALATQAAILETKPRLVLSVGIGGAYPWGGVQMGETIVSSEFVYANLGAEDGEDFLNLEQLGFPLLPNRFNTLSASSLGNEFARATGVSLGQILTVETVTGNSRTLARLERLYPDARCEAMEGAGVAHGAALYGIPALEIRGISNLVEASRNRDAWRIGAALTALHTALETGWDALLAG
jgi:futalosine hydrolase